jgi:hypothetical protein
MSSRLQHLAARVALPSAACSPVLGFGTVMAQADAEHHEIGHTSVFEEFPHPGHPFGSPSTTTRST